MVSNTSRDCEADSAGGFDLWPTGRAALLGMRIVAKTKLKVRGRPFTAGGRGGPGRPKGKPNKTTIDAAALRKRIVESWDRVGGDTILARIAVDSPVDYMRLVVSLIQRLSIDEQTAALPNIRIVIVQDSPAAIADRRLALEPPPALRLLPAPEPSNGRKPVRVVATPVPPQPDPDDPPICQSGRERDSRIDWRRDFDRL